MRKKIVYENENGGVRVFMRKQTNIENFKRRVEFEICRKELGITKVYLNPAEINESNLMRLKDYGCNLHWKDSNNIEREINDELDNLEDCYYHEEVGWFKLNDVDVFKGDRLLGESSSILSGLEETKFSLTKKGSFEEWLKAIKEDVIGDKYLELILVAGFSSALVYPLKSYSDVGNIILNLNGDSKHLKSISTDLATSIWGKVSRQQNGLIKRIGDKDNELLLELAGNRGVAIAIEEVSNLPKKRLVKLVSNISNLAYTGQDLNTTILLCSDQSLEDIIDKEKYIIMMETSKYEVEEYSLKKTLRGNYGHAGEIFVEKIIDTGLDEITNRFLNILSQFYKTGTKVKVAYDSMAKISILKLTAEIVNEALDLNINIQQLVNTLIELEIKMSTKTELNAYRDFLTYVYSNRAKFVQKGEDIKGNTIGLVEINSNNEISKVLIPSEKFNVIIEKLGFKRIPVLRAWKEQGLTDCRSNRIDKQFTFNGRTIWGIVVNVRGELYD